MGAENETKTAKIWFGGLLCQILLDRVAYNRSQICICDKVLHVYYTSVPKYFPVVYVANQSRR